MTEETPVNPQKEEAEAIGRIGLTPDGRLLHRYMRRVLETATEMLPDGALREQTGRRTLARDLMRLMAASVEAQRDGSEPEQPILTSASGPVGTGTRGTRRRVALEPGDGWTGES